MRKLKISILLVVSCLILTACGSDHESYKVTFDSNGGTSVKSQTIKKGETAKRPDDPIKDGYTFSGWYIDINNDLEYNFETKITKTITLIAKWIENESNNSSFTITFNTDGGNNIEQIVVENGVITNLPTPIKEGYNFLGWYSEDNKYDVGSGITENLTLIAKWEKINVVPQSNNEQTTNIISVEDKYTFKIVNYSDTESMVYVYKNDVNITDTISTIYNEEMTIIGEYSESAGAPIINNSNIEEVSKVLINGTTFIMTRIY